MNLKDSVFGHLKNIIHLIPWLDDTQASQNTFQKHTNKENTRQGSKNRAMFVGHEYVTMSQN